MSVLQSDKTLDTAFAGLPLGTQVMTLQGEMPVEFLTPGDRILTRAGARVLRAVTVTVARDPEVAVIRASTLGADRPEADTILPAGQKILVRDWRARALYGADAAMVPVARLADGEFIRIETRAELRLFDLRFDAEEVVYAAGLELACARATVAA